jgi:protein gp37
MPQSRDKFLSEHQEWQFETWNPFVGCRKISPGCAHCYMFRDQAKYGRDPAQIRRTGDKTFHAPLRYPQPRLILTCSWSDFFIEEGDAWRDEVWDVIRRTPQHIYIVLTKRPERIAQSLPPDWGAGWTQVWLGVTTENQKSADKRLPLLLEIPAALPWVCVEPLLGPLDLRTYMQGINWVITGAESGPQARPLDENWVRALRDQCQDANVPFCYKQNTVNGVRVHSPRLDGKIWDEMPPLPSCGNTETQQQLSLFG